MNDDDALRWEAEKRAILVALSDLGESFLPESDAPEYVARHKGFAELRSDFEQLGSIPDWSIIRGLFGTVRLFADGLHAMGDIARDSLDMNDEMLAEIEGKASARGFTAKQIRTKVQELRERFDKAPSRFDVAAALHTSEATLKRAVKELGIGPWPPAPPED